tara:strand:+ start:5386 stop:5634 length:249 start_codon:yes stop_codon:yes gene_type:complete
LIDPNETKKDKFKRVGSNRVNNTAKQIQLLGNLSNQNTYEYKDADIDDMEKYLMFEMTEAFKQLRTRSKKFDNVIDLFEEGK